MGRRHTQLLDGQLSGRSTPKNPVNERSGASKHVGETCPVRHEAAGLNLLSLDAHHGDAALQACSANSVRLAKNIVPPTRNTPSALSPVIVAKACSSSPGRCTSISG